MKYIQRQFCSILFCVLFVSQAVAQAPLCTWTLQRSLDPLESSCAAIQPIDGVMQNRFIRDSAFGQCKWAYFMDGNAVPVSEQSGLEFNRNVFSGMSYTIELIVRYREILDEYFWTPVLHFKNRETDDALYIYDFPAVLQIFVYDDENAIVNGDGSVIINNTEDFYHIVISFEHTSSSVNRVRAYVNGDKEIDVSGSLTNKTIQAVSLPSSGLISIVCDSNVDGNAQVEFNDADAMLVRIYDFALTDSQVAVLAADPFVNVPSCPADYDGTGFIDTDDFDAFSDLFDLGDPKADFDCTGFVDTEDFDAFVEAYEAGC
jgi:hypothetical protein